MTTISKAMTLEEFLAFTSAPENADSSYEFMDGEVIPLSPGRTPHSELEHLIAIAIHNFCRAHNIPVHTSGGDAAYLIADKVVAPDFAYKTTSMIDDYPDPEPPLLVAEIISPTDKPSHIRRKRTIYEQTQISYWEIYPTEQLIDVYEPGKPARTLRIDDSLDGGAVIPGFTLPLKELFAE